MGNILNNLYPPIIASYMPAFLISQKECRIYFSISNFNSYDDIKYNPQISIKYQNTNLSALDANKFPNGIMVITGVIQKDLNRKSDDMYYIDIPVSAMENQTFEINQYYKVQIRFTSIDAADNYSFFNNNYNPSVSWLNEYSSAFSEWSSVCLIKGISQPSLSLIGLEQNNNQSFTFSSDILDISGKLLFDDILETEKLKSYRIKLFDVNKKIILDSGEIYSNTTDDENKIFYTCKEGLIDGSSYTLEVQITTNNLYSNSFYYNFTVILPTTGSVLPLNIAVAANDDLACATIHLTPQETAVGKNTFSSNIIIRRTSSRSNFTFWEDVLYSSLIINDELDFYWNDYSVESGVWYTYCVQEIDAYGYRGLIIKQIDSIRIDFEDMFLVANQNQLKIKYNQNISSYKKNISEYKIDTLGSKYPFIKRGGYNEYRVFPITGLITFLNDFNEKEEKLDSKEKIYGNEKIVKMYDDYNYKNRITKYNDYILEREFREKVINFLYEDNVKLLKTLTEGNFLVKLMDINLTPNTQLGRYIYTFSANAYEIDDNTIDNLDRYNIQQKNINYSMVSSVEKEVLGQVGPAFIKNREVCDIIKNKCNTQAQSQKVINFKYLKELHIEFLSKPYLIKEMNGTLVPYKNNMPFDKSTVSLGYIIVINGVTIKVSPYGYYSLKGEDIQVTSLLFAENCEANVNYVVCFDESRSTAGMAKSVFTYQKIGQVWGTFKYDESIFNRIWKKYFIDFKKYYQRLISINRVEIETDPYTVVWVKESQDKGFNRHVVNDTGTLQIYDEDTVIQGIYFSGVHLNEANENEQLRETLPINTFINTNITIESINEISEPIDNGVYYIKKPFIDIEEIFEPNSIGVEEDKVEISMDREYKLLIQYLIDNSNRMIFYKGKWSVFTEDNDVLCDVDGLVNYYCEVMKGVY